MLSSRQMQGGLVLPALECLVLPDGMSESIQLLWRVWTYATRYRYKSCAGRNQKGFQRVDAPGRVIQRRLHVRAEHAARLLRLMLPIAPVHRSWGKRS